MRSFKRFINEAKTPVPSALRKFKKGSREVENTYKTGDIYDLSGTDTYNQTDSYYTGDGDGYIMDKNGNVYDVKCSEGSGDAGRIVGGSFQIGVSILRVGPNKEDIYLSGYSAVFSSPSSDTFDTLISDIKDGIYLEDYLAYHKADISFNTRDTEWVNKLINNGDGEGSRTIKMKKRDSKINKEESFNQRYCVITSHVTFNCTNGQTLEEYKDGGWNNIVAEIFPSKTKNAGKIGLFGDNNIEKKVKVPKEVNSAIINGYKPFAQSIISNMFGSADVSGMKFNFSVSFEGQQEYGGPVFGWDIKKNQFVVLDMEKRKVLDRKYEIRLGSIFHKKYNNETVYNSDFTNKFFSDASKIIIKSLGSESAYVAANYKSVMWGNGYWKPQMKAGEAKERCKEQFRQMKSNKTYSPDMFNFYVTPEIASQVLGSNTYRKYFKAGNSVAEETTSTDMTPEISNGPEKPNSKTAEEIYGKAYVQAKEKMIKWHEGTRKQNLKNCNDGKLRMNYAICKELGYEDECNQLSREAKTRGIMLESKLSMTEYIQAVID